MYFATQKNLKCCQFIQAEPRKPQQTGTQLQSTESHRSLCVSCGDKSKEAELFMCSKIRQWTAGIKAKEHSRVLKPKQQTEGRQYWPWRSSVAMTGPLLSQCPEPPQSPEPPSHTETWSQHSSRTSSTSSSRRSHFMFPLLLLLLPSLSFLCLTQQSFFLVLLCGFKHLSPLSGLSHPCVSLF